MTIRDKLKSLTDDITAHPGNNYELNEVAQRLEISPFHLHRLFSHFAGLPLHQYVTQARLQRAATQLAYRQSQNITDIAFEAGYQTPESFNRAFKLRFGVSPSAFRKSPVWPSEELKLPSSQESEQRTWRVNVKTVNAVPIAVLPYQGSARSFPTALQSFIAWRKANKLPPSRYRTFNFLYENSDSNFRIALATQFNPDQPPPELDGMYFTHLPAGEVAHIVHRGPDDLLSGPATYLFSDWLPSTDYQPVDIPLVLERIKFFPEATGDEIESHLMLFIEHA